MIRTDVRGRGGSEKGQIFCAVLIKHVEAGRRISKKVNLNHLVWPYVHDQDKKLMTHEKLIKNPVSWQIISAFLNSNSILKILAFTTFEVLKPLLIPTLACHVLRASLLESSVCYFLQFHQSISLENYNVTV